MNKQEWVSRFRRSVDEAPELPASPGATAAFLLAGNARFIADTAADITAPSTARSPDGAITLPIAPTPKQAPLCVILGCSDARVPAELIFNAKPNQLFVVRVAGNVLGEECLGSIEYALASFKDSLHLLVVLGHTGCGAVGAAVDSYLNPKMSNSIAFTRSLRSLVNHIFLAVHEAALALEDAWGPEVKKDPGYRSALLEAAVYLNAAMTSYQLQEEIGVKGSPNGVRVVYAVYDVATSRVIGPDLDPATDDTSKLADAPAVPDDILALGREIAVSSMVSRHLEALMATRRPPLLS